MLLINNINLPLDTDFSNLKPIIAKQLRLRENEIISAQLYKKSVDARHKKDIHFCCSFIFSTNKNQNEIIRQNKNVQVFENMSYNWPKSDITPENRPVIIGFGPAGIFAALTLARAGLNPIVLERGQDVDTRTKDIESFFAGGNINPQSNVQFGEGGAGTFSDGKLNTGIKNIRCRAVLEEFVKNGAPKNILTDAKPHIGTDILKTVIKNIRKIIISLGGEIFFDTCLEDLVFEDNRIVGIVTSKGKIKCDSLILAIGHSARDTFKMLKKHNLEMIRKPFAMGVRIEHLQSQINKSLYGDFAEHPALSAADYKLNVHLQNGRGVYTFCMCPGGEVINASSENGGIAVNGMSYNSRDGVNANSALLVGVNPDDIEGEDVLGGCELQRQIEEKAYNIGQGKVPVTTVGNFVFDESFKITNIVPTVKPDYCYGDFTEIFPSFITESLKEAIVLLDKKLNGFADKAAVLTAPETRSSSPIRIVRGEDFTSINHFGVYPCGEGAGYAGGIMSAAVDGIATAEAVISNLKLNR